MTDEIRRIDNPPEIMWAGNRSLLLTLRHAQRVFRTDPELADDLLGLVHADARQIVEDAALVVTAARGNAPAFGRWSTPWPRASWASWARMMMPTDGRRSRTVSEGALGPAVTRAGRR